jgi:putative sigma-54 modulation protein
MQMEYALKNTHVKGSEISEFLEEKTSKLEKFLEGRFHARWAISFDNNEHEAHLHVTGNNFDHVGKDRDANLFTAIEGAVEKVERQLQKHKEVVQNHHAK